MDVGDSEKLVEALRVNTKVVLMDTISNYTLRCYDVEKIANLVHQKSRATLVVDNTFFTPVF